MTVGKRLSSSGTAIFDRKEKKWVKRNAKCDQAITLLLDFDTETQFDEILSNKNYFYSADEFLRRGIPNPEKFVRRLLANILEDVEGKVAEESDATQMRKANREEARATLNRIDKSIAALQEEKRRSNDPKMIAQIEQNIEDAERRKGPMSQASEKAKGGRKTRRRDPTPFLIAVAVLEQLWPKISPKPPSKNSDGYFTQHFLRAVSDTIGITISLAMVRKALKSLTAKTHVQDRTSSLTEPRTNAVAANSSADRAPAASPDYFGRMSAPPTVNAPAPVFPATAPSAPDLHAPDLRTVPAPWQIVHLPSPEVERFYRAYSPATNGGLAEPHSHFASGEGASRAAASVSQAARIASQLAAAERASRAARMVSHLGSTIAAADRAARAIAQGRLRPMTEQEARLFSREIEALGHAETQFQDSRYPGRK